MATIVRLLDSGESVMELSLEAGEGIVIVNGRDADGVTHVIGQFGPGGFERQPGIPASTGWPLDGDGKILII